MLLCLSVERAAQVNGRGCATAYLGRTRTWTEFRSRVARLASGLKALGLNAGDRVAILGANSDSYLEALYAVWWFGGVVVPMNFRWSPQEHQGCLEDAGVAALLFDAVHEGVGVQLGAGLPTGRSVLMRLDSPPAGSTAAEALIADAEPLPLANADPSALAGLYYTGGTTGRPKGVMLSASALWSSAMSMALELKLDRRDTYLHAAPVFHLGDGQFTLAITLVAGTHIILPAFRPQDVLEAVRAHRVSVTLLVPTMVRMLLDCETFDPAAVGSLRCLAYGAAAMPEATRRDAAAALPRAELVQVYGQTELAPLAAAFHESEAKTNADEGGRPNGRASFSVQVKIAREDGQEAPRGVVGEIWVRGPNAMLGYWRAPELTAVQMQDGWVKTGDLGHMDEGGFVYICDRAKDMIISGGENIFSVEVENALLLHPGVKEAAVIGLPDPVYGEKVHAVVVAKEAASLECSGLDRHCRTLIAGYKVPRSFEFRTASLPLSSTGKPLKSELRRAWAARLIADGG